MTILQADEQMKALTALQRCRWIRFRNNLMDKPVRKIIRLDNYDYSKNGLYFITICTVQKNELLWATDVGDGAPDVPTPRQPLSPCMACEKNTNLTPSSGLSRAPAPTMLKLHNFRTQANNVRPYISFWQVPSAAKSLRSLRILLCTGG